MAKTEAQKMLDLLADKRRTVQLAQLDAQARKVRHAVGCDDCKPKGKR
jgi:hypothetical protein